MSGREGHYWEGSRSRWIGREGGIEKWGRGSEFESPWDDGKEEATETSVLARETVSMIVGVTSHFSLDMLFPTLSNKAGQGTLHFMSIQINHLRLLFFLYKYTWCYEI